MSKADEKSKQYRDFREECGIKDPVMLDEIEEAYYEGCHQAEKDLELTWRDIAVINNIVTKMLNDCGNNILYDTEKDFCQEVLKRFKERKVE